jgi:pimeloyl-ACP methyl ester carboxylesterase
MPTASGTFVDLPSRGIRLHYRDWGGDGDPILLLHGLSSNSRIWDLPARTLASRRRVIALDLRGHGLSDVPDDGYGFEETVADVIAFLDVLGLDSVAIAGHSWGANVALCLAAGHPARATGVVLVDGGIIEPSRFSDWATAERQMTPPDIPGVPVDTFLGYARQWPHIKDLWSDEIGEMVLSNFEIRDGRVYRRLDIPRHMKIARAIYDYRPTELMKKVSCPVLVIVATMPATSESEQRWQDFRSDGIAIVREQMPHAQLHVMENSIHDLPVQRPAELAELIAAFGV